MKRFRVSIAGLMGMVPSWADSSSPGTPRREPPPLPNPRQVRQRRPGREQGGTTQGGGSISPEPKIQHLPPLHGNHSP